LVRPTQHPYREEFANPGDFTTIADHFTTYPGSGAFQPEETYPFIGGKTSQLNRN
jgi:hypothetical protein